MGQLMLRCPMTDRNFSTGIDTDRKSLKRIPYARIVVRCPYCGLRFPEDAIARHQIERASQAWRAVGAGRSVPMSSLSPLLPQSTDFSIETEPRNRR